MNKVFARFSRLGRSAPLPVVGALLLLLITVRSASAHAGITPDQVPPRTNQTFVMQVPNEKDVPTTQFRLEFPAGLTISRFQPKPGWQRQVEKDSAGRIIAATWSGGQIGPGEYDDFTFIARTPNEEGTLFFKAYQTYEGGEVVEWINTSGEDRPAPSVVVKATASAGSAGVSIENNGQAPSDATATSDTSAANSSPAPTIVVASEAPITANDANSDLSAPTSANAASGGSDAPLFASLGALVISLVALALAGVALARRRQTT